MNQRAQSIPPQQSDTLAALCKASGDELRLNVLRVLASDSFGVLELAQIFDIGQSGMSHHLKVLAQAELVATRREGNAIFYRRAPHLWRSPELGKKPRMDRKPGDSPPTLPPHANPGTRRATDQTSDKEELTGFFANSTAACEQPLLRIPTATT